MPDFLMPKLGADMTAGTLVAWLKKSGDAVRRGDIVAEVETDKGVIDVEIFADGVLDKLQVQPGQKVPVGTVLATVRGASEPLSPAIAAKPPTLPSETLTPPMPVSATAAPDASRLPISPSARALARQLGVDPSKVRGTGRGGAITRDDIERAASGAKAAAPEAPAADRQLRLRQTIAAAMSRSKREIPHYYLSTTIDMHPAMTWLAEQNAKRPLPERMLYGVLLLKAVARALKEVPELNATWSEGRPVTSEAIHVGVAIALRQGGLVAPAIHDTDKLTIDELMAKFRDLVQRARSWSLRSSELSDPTITVTSLGEQGVETVFGVIHPPQVAIVGFGKIVERPWVVGGQIIPRPVITATLSGDHRVSDGHRGGLFLAALERLLQEPAKL
jgi:pyruvate dehydrogenase E2 component (dihydrolipoamide acetyltransferase)